MTRAGESPAIGTSRGLRWLFGSTAAAVTGQGAVTAAAPLLAASLTRDPVEIAIVAAAAWAPWLLIGLQAGALVDRWDPRRVMVTTDLIRAGVMLTFGMLVLWGHATTSLLTCALLIVAAGSCFFDPASQSAIPIIVGRDRTDLAKANGTFWSIDTLSRTLIGATVGAVLFSRNPAWPFLGQGALLLGSGLMLLGLPKRRYESRSDPRKIREEIRTGIRTLWLSDVLRRNAVLMGIYNVAYNLSFATLILLLQRNLNITSVLFGVLLASAAVGGVFGGWLARHLNWMPTSAYAVGFAVQAGGWLLVLAAPNVPVATVGFVAIGAVSTLVSAVGGAASQAATPDGMLGRVTSATRLAGLGAASVGSLMSGVVAVLGGLAAPGLLASAILVLAATWATVHRNPRRRPGGSALARVHRLGQRHDGSRQD